MGIGLYGLHPEGAPPVPLWLWVVVLGFMAWAILTGIIRHMRAASRVKHWRQWTPSKWWYAIGSDERFAPVGDREAMAYASGIRDSMRIIEDRWRGDSHAAMAREWIKDLQFELHRRAMLLERGYMVCPHGYKDWDNCGECCH